MASTFPGASQGRGGPLGVSPTDWRVQLLNQVGAPVTWPNLDALQAWALSESGYNKSYGTNMAGPLAYNPLAITDSYGVPYVGDLNSDGVKQFSSTSAGVSATARFLEHGYGDVIQALRDSNPDALYSAVNQSGWCSGCEGGVYPTALHSWIGGASFPGEHGGFHGHTGATPAASASQAAAGKLGKDSGGLYGSCGGGTSIPLLPFSLPPFGCYLLNTLKFGAAGGGGVILMLVGGYMVIRGVGVSKAMRAIPVVGEAAMIGALAGGRRSSSRASGGAAAAGANEPARANAAIEREDHARQVRAERLKAAKARTREANARARERGHRATQERLRTGSSTRLSADQESQLSRVYDAPGVPRRRPERMAG